MTSTRSSSTTYRHTVSAALILLTINSHASGLPATFDAAPAGTALSAQVSFSNLRYTLIDLDPNDNITPSITFTTEGVFGSSQTQGTGGLFGTLSAPQPIATLSTFETSVNHPSTYRVDTKINDGVSVRTTEWLPSTDQSVIASDGLSAVAIGSNYLANSSRISNTDVGALKVFTPPGSEAPEVSPIDTPVWQLSTATTTEAGARGVTHVIRQVNTVIDDSDPDNIVWEFKRVLSHSSPSAIDGRHRFELSPNTKVVFEGTASASVSRQLSDASFLNATEDIQAMVSAGAGMSVRLYDLPEGHATEWPDNAGYERDVKLESDAISIYTAYGRFFVPNYTPSPRFPPPPLDFSRSQIEDLSVSFSNDGTSVAIGSVYLSSSTSSVLAALPTAVPEPSRLLLFACGLLGLSLAVSRRPQSSMPNS